MADEPRQRTGGETERPADRLESWKEIAAYLRRDVRTVQRWEQTDGLPIHRHKRTHRAVPYAYKRELDDWWVNRSATTSSVDQPLPYPLRVSNAGVGVRRWWTAAVLVVVLIGTAYGLLRRHGRAGHEEEAPGASACSADARRLYSQADSMLQQDLDDRAAESLFRDAIAVDPRCASAYVMLAWTLRNQRRSQTDYLPFATRAEQLAEAAPEAERLFIRGAALDMRGNRPEACAAWRAAARVDARHFWATTNSLQCDLWDGDWIAAADLTGRRADLQTSDIDASVIAAWAGEFLLDDPARANPYLDRAYRLQRAGLFSRRLWSDAWLRLRPAYREWLENDSARALTDLVDIVGRDAGRLDAYFRDDLHTFAASFMLTLGRVRDAQRQCMHVADPASRSGCSTLIAYAEGAVDRARRFLAPYFGHGGEAGTIIGVRLGLGNRARDVLATSRARDGSPETEAIDGEFAFASGDPGRAVDHLSMAVRAAPGQSWYFLAAETLANALVAAGRPQDAIQVLETAAAERAHAYDPFNGGPVCGYFWLRVRLLQAELYSQQGRLGDRDQILRELEQLLSRADSDFPILVRARELEQSSSRPAQR